MKNLLLAQIAEEVTGVTLELSTKCMTDIEIQERTEVLERFVAKSERVFRILRRLGTGGVSLLVFSANLNPIGFIVAMLAALATKLLFHFIEDFVTSPADNHEELSLMAPLARSVECERVLEYLEQGGPKVRQWRDLALTERDQLRQYDHCIMRALHNRYFAEQVQATAAEKAQARQAQLDLACQKVHGIVDSPTAE